jgi:hypothetical protein
MGKPQSKVNHALHTYTNAYKILMDETKLLTIMNINLFQRLSVVIQRLNAVAFRGSFALEADR